VSIFTVGSELNTNSAANMNLLQSLGVGVVRLDMRWTDVAPDSTSPYGLASVATRRAYLQVAHSPTGADYKGGQFSTGATGSDFERP
jgi:hypothetical protein